MSKPIILADQMEVIRKHQEKTGVPPVHVVPITEELGINVFRAFGWPDDLSGTIRRVPETKDEYIIYVNADHHEHRRRFTIAHELAHLILHKSYIGDGITDDMLYRSGLSNKIEAHANRLAADILMPWSLLDPLIDSGVTDIGELAKRFRVSKSAMSIRLGVPFESSEPDDAAVA
jgi:predicted transcriptional regulator